MKRLLLVVGVLGLVYAILFVVFGLFFFTGDARIAMFVSSFIGFVIAFIVWIMYDIEQKIN